MVTKTTHTDRHTKEKTANRRAQVSLPQQGEASLSDLEGSVVRHLSSLSVVSMLMPDRETFEINKKVEDIYVHQVQEEPGKH